MAIKLAEQTNGPHIFMRLRLDSGRVEEIDAYTTEKGWHYEPQTHFDFVLGNPPFHLRWIMPDATVMTSHQYYCLKAAKLLKPLGILAVIVPASFLADSFSDKSAIRMMESRFSFLGQVMLPEHTFSDSGVDGFPTKLQFWQKKSTAADWTPKRYSTDCADIYIPSGHPVMAATALYEKFVMVAKADLAGNRNKVLLELAQLKTTKSTFLYQVKKYLYQIRSHPATREKYDACFSYVHRFYTQRQPGDMPYEEWQRVQLTEAKVLAYQGDDDQSGPQPFRSGVRRPDAASKQDFREYAGGGH